MGNRSLGRNEVVDLSGPPYTASEVAATLGRVLGRDVKAVVVSPEQHVTALVGAGFSRPIAEAFAEMYAFFNEGRGRLNGDRHVRCDGTLEQTLRSKVG